MHLSQKPGRLPRIAGKTSNALLGKLLLVPFALATTGMLFGFLALGSSWSAEGKIWVVQITSGVLLLAVPVVSAVVLASVAQGKQSLPLCAFALTLPGLPSAIFQLIPATSAMPLFLIRLAPSAFMGLYRHAGSAVIANTVSYILLQAFITLLAYLGFRTGRWLGVATTLAAVAALGAAGIFALYP